MAAFIVSPTLVFIQLIEILRLSASESLSREKRGILLSPDLSYANTADRRRLRGLMKEGKLILTFENPHKDIRDPEHGDNTGLIGHKDPGHTPVTLGISSLISAN